MKDARIIGCSAFGLVDSVSLPSEVLYSESFYLSDALLPESPYGKILVGEEAETERTHTGIYWPPEARIIRGSPVRRVPIPYAWRALVEAGDRAINWKIGSGVSFSVPKILANYLINLLNRQGFEETTAPVVVIPNHLDEYGQDALLEALAKAGYPHTTLIWRPVAAALSWLEHVKRGKNSIPIAKDDHIHVLYFGPEAIEFTTLRLKEYFKDEVNYVLPLRNRPKGDLPFSALDWAGRVIEEAFNNPDDGAFLQAFTYFPEVWQALRGCSPEFDTVQPWSLDCHWAQWQPSQSLPEQAWKTPVGASRTLRLIYEESCPLQPFYSTNFSANWENLLKTELKTLIGAYPQGGLRGIICCGPLVPNKIAEWFDKLGLDHIADKFEPIQNHYPPKIDKMWICPGEKVLAQGAAIYGKLLLEKCPTYLDTMPQLSILAQDQGRYQWVPLLKASEIMGGKEFTDNIKRKFKLGQGARLLKVLLQKGETESSTHADNTETEGPEPKVFNVQSCRARLVREVIRGAGTLERAVQVINVHPRSELSEFALKYAQLLFGGEETTDSVDMDSLNGSQFNQPFRKAVFNFPSSPNRDMPLDIAVRIKPASGLAQIEILPEDPSFLKGRRVYLDYSTMRHSSKLPEIQRGWPRIREIPVHPQDVILDYYRDLIKRFEETPVSSLNYEHLIDIIRNIFSRTEPAYVFGKEIKTKAIDQNGFPCTNDGKELIKRVADKYQLDFEKVESDQLLSKIFVRASWLWGATPKPVTEHLETVLKDIHKKRRWQWAVEAASRSFTTYHQFSLFYDVIANYYHSVTFGVLFPVNSARSICRLLMYRRNACLSLDRDKAYLFAQGALERLIEEHENGKYKETFFRCVMLLLYLLRVRRGDPGAFNPTSVSNLHPFLKAKDLMTEAVKHARQNRDYRRANGIEQVISGLDKYLEYEGDEGTISVLTDLAGEI